MEFKHKDLDGVWNRLLPGGILECRYPNDGIGFDPQTKPRHQYKVAGVFVWYRRLPAEGSDTWADSPIQGVEQPWVRRARGELNWSLYSEFVEASLDNCPTDDILPRIENGDRYYPEIVIVETTENGRYIFWKDGMFEVQPRNDNYWIKCKTIE